MLILPKLEVKYPMALERRYAKELRAYVRQEMAIIREYVPTIIASEMANSIRVDEEEPEDDDDWIALLLLMIFGDVAKRTFVKYRVENIFDDVLRYATTQYGRIVQSVFGSTPMPPSSMAADMQKMKDLFVYQNLKLITSIDEEIREALYYSIAQNSVSSVDEATLKRQITDFLKRRTELSEKRATLIGADQVGKLYGQLDQYQQQKDGVEEYVWRTMMDSRVREQHREREGKIFRWDEPPSDGHPGWAIRCRCHAAPLFNTETLRNIPTKGRYTEFAIKNGKTYTIVK